MSPMRTHRAVTPRPPCRGRRAWLLVWTGVGAAGCVDASPASTRDNVTDAMGRTVEVGPPALRLVSLVPSATEIVVALGAGDRLVGATTLDEALAARAIPSVGDGLDPSLEVLATLRPDLVVAWSIGGTGSVVRTLEELGIRVYAAEPQDLEDVHRLTGDLGRLLDLEQAADSLIAATRASLERLTRTLADAKMPSVFYTVWHSPPMTTGAGTFLDQIITAAGGRNVFGDVTDPWPYVSIEEVLMRDPDVILVLDSLTEPAWVRESVGWSALRAVREGRVFALDPDLFSRPGPRVAEAAWTLGRLLHPTRLGAPPP